MTAALQSLVWLHNINAFLEPTGHRNRCYIEEAAVLILFNVGCTKSIATTWLVHTMQQIMEESNCGVAGRDLQCLTIDTRALGYSGTTCLSSSCNCMLVVLCSMLETGCRVEESYLCSHFQDTGMWLDAEHGLVS
jgi:hypothetical protein